VTVGEPRLGRMLYAPETIAARVSEIAADLNRRFAGRPAVVVAVLKGATVFLADLLRRLTFPVTVDFVRIASYGSGRRPGEIRFIKDVELPLEGRDVIVVDDIVDTGGTLARLKQALEGHRPSSVTTVALLRRAPKRRLPPTLDLVGFELESDEFVAGYGIDCAERFRELGAIHAVAKTE
jgi:hypoxanthine phosphoribosyltransferase